MPARESFSKSDQAQPERCPEHLVKANAALVRLLRAAHSEREEIEPKITSHSVPKQYCRQNVPMGGSNFSRE